MPFEYSIKKDRDRKAFTGQFIWTGFDYIGEPTPYSVYPVGVSSFGVIDTAGFPKDAFYLYKSQWTSGDTDPMVHISPMNWDSWEDGEDVSVWVYSNVERVDLYLNDELVGSKSFDKKVTDYGYEYYETSEYVADDKTWGDESNPGGYVSENSEVVEANGDSEIAEGAKFGRLHLTWDIPYEEGELVAKAYNEEGELVAVDSIATSGVPYTIEAKVNKNVIAADGDSLAYVECTIVDEDGNMVADADNLVKFDVTGGAIAGVDNGAQESAELYKWGNVEKNTHSERSAYNGKVLAILQSNEGETGEMVLTISSEGLAPVQVKVAVTEDGTGEAPEAVTSEVEFNSINDTKVSVPVGVVPTLPSIVSVNYTDSVNGSYSVNRSVVWDEIDASDVGEVGIFSVYGTVDGIEEKAEAVINVERVMESQDISTNPALEDNDDTYDFSQLPEDSEIRNGALATASFTGSSRSYPNNMVDGDQNGVWTNAYNRSATALLPAVNASKPASSVEFYWDSVRVAEKISLYFTVDGSNAIPADFDVQYWDGENWVSASGQNVVKAEASNEETVLTFDPVVTTRVKVLMTNATPYSSTGNMTISNAVVYGWNLNTEEEEPGTVITAPESAIKNETFEVSVLTEQDISGITVKNENDRTVTTHITSMNQDTADGKLTVFTLAVGTAGTGRVLSVYDGETLLGTFTLDIEEVPSSIVSVTAPESALEDELFRITAVTTRDLFKGKVYNENGGVIRSTRVSVSYNGDYAESIYELSVGTAFDTARKLTFKADYDKHNDFPFAYDFEIMINEA